MKLVLAVLIDSTFLMLRCVSAVFLCICFFRVCVCVYVAFVNELSADGSDVFVCALIKVVNTTYYLISEQ